MFSIKKQLISDTPYKYGRGNGRRYITYHETGNTNQGATAQMHANLQSNGNSRDAAWHYQSDDKKIIQSFTHDFQLWQSGDGQGDGNLNSIAWEICVNSDANMKKAYQKAAKGIKKLMKQEGIPLSNVVPHSRWSGKDCPHFLRNGGKGVNESQFRKMIAGEKVKVSKPKKEKTKATTISNNLGLVDWMKASGFDSSLSNRKKLASQYGIKNYSGTAKQNTKLLKKLQNKPNKKASGSKRINTIQTTVNSRYNAGITVDGIDGPKTKKALILGLQTELNKQFNAGLIVDGIWGKKTASACVTVFKGAKGNLSWLIQARLYCLGYDPKGLDGIFGDGMEKAVKAFQSDNGLNDDGKPGKQTFARLFG